MLAHIGTKKVFIEWTHGRMMTGKQGVKTHEEITNVELYIKRSLVTLIRVQNFAWNPCDIIS